MKTAEDWCIAAARLALAELKKDGKPDIELRRLVEYRTASCEGKERYGTAVLARKVLIRRKRAGGSKRSLIAYHCPHCGGWHIGNTMGNRARAAKEIR